MIANDRGPDSIWAMKHALSQRIRVHIDVVNHI